MDYILCLNQLLSLPFTDKDMKIIEYEKTQFLMREPSQDELIAYINEEYDSSELIQRDPREISVLVVTNEDDIVKRVEIGENAWKSYLGHEYEEWDYDLFEDY